MPEFKNVILLFATPTEKDKLSEPCLFECIDYGLNVDVIITGVGIGNVIKALSNYPHRNLFQDDETLLINIGYSGSNVITVNTKVIVSQSLLFHPNSTIDTPNYSLFTNFHHDYEQVPCYSSSDFVLDAKGITDPAVFDMELYAIASFGIKNLISIKTISDNLSAHQYLETVGESV